MLVYFRIKTTFLLFEIYNFWFSFPYLSSIIFCFFFKVYLMSSYFRSNFPPITRRILSRFFVLFRWMDPFISSDKTSEKSNDCWISLEVVDGLRPLFRSNLATDFREVKGVTSVFFFILWILTLRFALLFLRLSFSFSNFAIFFCNQFWLWRFLFLDDSPLLGKDIETIKDVLWFGEDVDDISVVVSIKEDSSFKDWGCFFPHNRTASLLSFSSFFKSSFVLV